MLRTGHAALLRRRHGDAPGDPAAPLERRSGQGRLNNGFAAAPYGRRMRRSSSRISRWLLGRLVECFRELGKGWTPLPGPAPGEEPPPSGPVAGGPPPGHPERLCGDVPLTRTERMLMAQLRDLGDRGDPGV
jgi:uncharacterized protein DUF6059